MRRPHGPQVDPRFTLHRVQPRADKLADKQRRLCRVDPAFADALRSRVGSAERFAAFMDGSPSYLAISSPCRRCGDFRRRTRDRSCYACHLSRGGANWQRMQAGLRPIATRSLDSHLDLLARRKRERIGEVISRQFGGITVKLFPTGKLEVTFPDGFIEPDLSKTSGEHVHYLATLLPELREALIWAGWH